MTTPTRTTYYTHTFDEALKLVRECDGFASIVELSNTYYVVVHKDASKSNSVEEV